MRGIFAPSPDQHAKVQLSSLWPHFVRSRRYLTLIRTCSENNRKTGLFCPSQPPPREDRHVHHGLGCHHREPDQVEQVRAARRRLRRAPPQPPPGSSSPRV